MTFLSSLTILLCGSIVFLWFAFEGLDELHTKATKKLMRF